MAATGSMLALALFPADDLPESGFGVWQALLVIQAGLFGAIAPRLAVWRRVDLLPLLSSRTTQRSDFWGVVLLLALFAAAGAVSIHFITEQLPDPAGWRARLIVLELWGLLCVSEAVQGLRVVYLTADDKRWADAVTEGPTDRTIEDYRKLQNRLRVILNILGLAITSVVVADGALLQASANCESCQPLRGPATHITLLVGLLHAAGLAFIYLPPLTRVDSIARQLVTGWAPLGHGDATEPGNVIDLRDKLRTELKPGAGGRESFEAGAIIIGPLLAAVIAAFVPT